MSGKKWLFMFALTVFSVLLLCAGLSILVDPFGVFGDPLFDWYSYNETNNPRTAKLAYLEKHHGEYDSYVIGSSSAASLDPNELNAYTGARFYNLFVYGCDTKDYCDFASYILGHYEVKNLILNIGINEANTYDEGEDSYTGRMHARATDRSELFFYLSYALANPRYAVEKLISRAKDTDVPQVFDVFDAPTGTYDKRLRDVEQIGDLKRYEAAHGADFAVSPETAGLPYIEECAASVAMIRDLCREKGVNLTVIASPVYIAQWEAYDEGTLRAYKTALANETDYYDFSLTPISYDTRYFYDATHFRNAVGSMILAEIFGNDEVWRPEPFGTLVTAQNCAGYLDSLFQSPPVPEESDHTASLPVLMYHHFAENPENDMTISPEVFREQIKALADAGYRAVDTADLIAYVRRGIELPEKPVLITMDDGYLSNYEIAWGILEEYGMKATIFPIGSTFGNREFYKDTEYPIKPHFDFDEAREMLASGVIDIQSHTYDMHAWPPFEEDNPGARSDMLPLDGESEEAYAAAVRSDLETYDAIRKREFGEDFRALAYPSGLFTDYTEILVHGAGIEVTFSTEAGKNTLVKGLAQTLYALRRYTVTNDTTPDELLGWLEP